MLIPINKDLEESYKDEFMKGFTLSELAHILVSVLIIAGVTTLIWRCSGLAPDVCIYMGLPCGIPTLLLGFKRFQGLSAKEYLKEIFYVKRTRVLAYDADELPESSWVFSLERESGKKRRINR